MHKSFLTFGTLTLVGGLAALAQNPPQTPPEGRPPPQRPNDAAPPQPQQRPGAPTGANDVQGVVRSLEGTWSFTMRMPGAEDRAQEISGIATRELILEGNVLREELRVTSASGVRPESPGQDRPGQQPGGNNPNEPRRPGGGPSAEQQEPQHHAVSIGFEGLGLFAANAQRNEISHVWADSQQKGLVYSVGRFDAGTRTITFRERAGGLSDEGAEPDHRPMNDPARRDEQDRAPAAGGQDRPPAGGGAGEQDRDPAGGMGAPGAPQQPSGRNPGDMGDSNSPATVTLRIVSENEHIVTMRQPGQGPQQEYTITYTRTQDGRRPGSPGAPNRPDPNRPSTDQPRTDQPSNNPPSQRPGNRPDGDE